MQVLLRLLLALLLATGMPAALLAAEATPEAPILPGHSFILAAAPSLIDRYFYHTVVAVTAHGDTGYIGVILNQPETVTLAQIFPDYQSTGKQVLFNGGPDYPNQFFYIVRGTEAITGAAPFSDSAALAFNLGALQDLLAGKRNHAGLRVMHGVASWFPGQLENEIKRGGWRVLPYDEAILFDRDPENLWQQLQGTDL